MFDLSLNIYFRQSLAISAFDFHASVQHRCFQVLILKQTTFTITENDFLRDKRDAYKKVFAKQPVSWTFCSTLRCSCHIKRWQ